ncbi:MAG TPA: hypothetical protein PK038_05960, partial [Solirubrobacterales bacterium]|nr:hypothetical protein [Solirubrobacterales bacterium]
MRRLVLLAVLATFALLPGQAQALKFKIVNQSGRSADQVFVTVAGSPSNFNVPSVPNNEPVKLSSIPGQAITIN